MLPLSPMGSALEGLHLLLAAGWLQGNAHVHDLAPFPDKNFDMSHTINGLAFGQAYPGMRNPLDGVTVQQRNERNPSGATGMFQYFLRVGNLS